MLFFITAQRNVSNNDRRTNPAPLLGSRKSVVPTN